MPHGRSTTRSILLRGTNAAVASPFLSVIIPAFDEEARIGSALESLTQHLSGKPYEWEIIVADDGSTDRTREIVEAAAESDPRIHYLGLRHGGKGWAIKNGMLHSTAEWRFMCDADLSMPAEHIDRFLPNDQGPDHDIGIGSREAAGSQRFNEPQWRHITGRLFNYVARLIALGGLNDTQCGFKLYRGSLADEIFDLQTSESWGFDVEVLYLSRKMGATIEEIPIDWHFSAESKMGFLSGGLAFLDILAVRWNDVRGKYGGMIQDKRK